MSDHPQNHTSFYSSTSYCYSYQQQQQPQQSSDPILINITGGATTTDQLTVSDHKLLSSSPTLSSSSSSATTQYNMQSTNVNEQQQHQLQKQTPSSINRNNNSSNVNNTSNSTVSNVRNNDHGHYFIKKTFHKPTYCHNCTEMLWGLIGQGLICEVCNFVCHDKCQKYVISPCFSIASSLIKNPVSHCWSEPMHFKRKFCNVCRKRLEDNITLKCEICEYYVHIECQELAINDCCETATYTPNSNCDTKPIQHVHHWREGNLPLNSKCIICKKTCWTSECLAGMRCEWCGITVHSMCRIKVNDECNFGSLKDIIVPPYAVSVPRIADLNKETVLCIQHSQQQQSQLQQQQQQQSKQAYNKNRRISTDVSSSGGEVGGRQSSNSGAAGGDTCSNESIKDPSSPIQTTTPTSPQPPQTPPAFNNCIDYDEEDHNKELIKVFDGNTSYRKNLFRTIAANKKWTYSQLLESVLNTFQINEDPSKYYLSIYNKQNEGTNEVLIDNKNSVFESINRYTSKNCNINASSHPPHPHSHPHHHVPSIFLRYKDNEIESLKIYLSTTIKNVNDESTGCCYGDYQIINANSKTTVNETIKLALEKFNISDLAEKYLIVELLIDHDAPYERVLENDECPLQIFRIKRKESLCNHRMLRFCLKEKDNQNSPSVSVFIGNLPNALSQIQYEKILMDSLKNSYELRWNRFDVIYYEYGSMVMVYDDAEKAVKAFRVLKDASFDDKQLLVLLLPTIQPPMISSNMCPLLVFVNVKSGGQQGAELITSFRHLLNPHQVFDLQNGGPLPGLYVFRNIESYRILACGGDGTVGWVLSCLDNVSQDAKCQSPPMAIVPLGTGNDLARVLRWGAGYTGAEEPINLLRDVINAEEIMLDRWTVVFHSDENKENDEAKRQITQQITTNQSTTNPNEDNTCIYLMNNYFGIGIEADICLDFHMAREENPNKFNSRLHNKKYYIQLGLRKMMNKGACKDFNRHVIIEVDGKRVDLPQIEGIIILNILSWGSGANPWGPEKDNQFQKPTHYDGMLEVVGIKGVVHIGQIQSGMSGAIRLAQGGRIKIRMNTDMPVQVDGEPWLQAPCTITILKSALKATMLKKTKTKIKRRNTEPSVFNGSEGGSGGGGNGCGGGTVKSSTKGGTTSIIDKNAESVVVDQDGDSEPF